MNFSKYIFIILFAAFACKQETGQLHSEKVRVSKEVVNDSAEVEDASPKFVKKIVEQSDIVSSVPSEAALPIEKKSADQKEIAEKPTIKKVKKLASTPKKTSKPKKVKKKAQIVFSKTTYDFGRIVQGEKVQHEFEFVNNGDSPLVIKNAEASCGCTQPIYPFIPIEKGEKGKIFVQFNSKGRLGRQNPFITITSNASTPITKIYLEGEVVTKEFESGSSRK